MATQKYVCPMAAAVIHVVAVGSFDTNQEIQQACAVERARGDETCGMGWEVEVLWFGAPSMK